MFGNGSVSSSASTSPESPRPSDVVAQDNYDLLGLNDFQQDSEPATHDFWQNNTETSIKGVRHDFSGVCSWYEEKQKKSQNSEHDELRDIVSGLKAQVEILTAQIMKQQAVTITDQDRQILTTLTKERNQVEALEKELNFIQQKVHSYKLFYDALQMELASMMIAALCTSTDYVAIKNSLGARVSTNTLQGLASVIPGLNMAVAVGNFGLTWVDTAARAEFLEKIRVFGVNTSQFDDLAEKIARFFVRAFYHHKSYVDDKEAGKIAKEIFKIIATTRPISRDPQTAKVLCGLVWPKRITDGILNLEMIQISRADDHDEQRKQLPFFIRKVIDNSCKKYRRKAEQIKFTLYHGGKGSLEECEKLEAMILDERLATILRKLCNHLLSSTSGMKEYSLDTILIKNLLNPDQRENGAGILIDHYDAVLQNMKIKTKEKASSRIFASFSWFDSKMEYSCKREILIEALTRILDNIEDQHRYREDIDLRPSDVSMRESGLRSRAASFHELDRLRDTSLEAAAQDSHVAFDALG